jgi:hypothetical protein
VAGPGGSSRRAARRTGETERSRPTGEVESRNRPRPRPAGGWGRRPRRAHSPAPGARRPAQVRWRAPQRRPGIRELLRRCGRDARGQQRPAAGLPEAGTPGRPRTARGPTLPQSWDPHRGALAELRRPPARPVASASSSASVQRSASSSAAACTADPCTADPAA